MNINLLQNQSGVSNSL